MQVPGFKVLSYEDLPDGTRRCILELECSPPPYAYPPLRGQSDIEGPGPSGLSGQSGRQGSNGKEGPSDIGCAILPSNLPNGLLYWYPISFLTGTSLIMLGKYKIVLGGMCMIALVKSYKHLKYHFSNHGMKKPTVQNSKVVINGAVLFLSGLTTCMYAFGPGTPYMVKASGIMSTIGGFAMFSVGGLIMLLPKKNEQKTQHVMDILQHVGAMSNPFGLLGAFAGFLLKGKSGIKKGAYYGNMLQVSHGVGRFIYSHQCINTAGLEAFGRKYLHQSVKPGTLAILKFFAIPACDWSNGTLENIINKTWAHKVICAIDSAPPWASDLLAEKTGRIITTFEGVLKNGTNVNFCKLVDNSVATPTLACPTYSSPYLYLWPNILAPLATLLNSIF